jgi:hypothetical protein
MPNKSNSNQQQTNEDSKKNIEDLTDDLDFWDIESDSEETASAANDLLEIENMMADHETSQQLKPTPEKEFNKEASFEKDIINSLDQHKGGGEISDFDDISKKNVNELLVTANAEMIPEQEGGVGELPKTTEDNKPTQNTKTDKTPAEKIATLACYLAIVGIFTYLIIYVSKQHNFDTSKVYATNTPVRGDYANVESIETWWSKPAGKNTKFGVILVPSATITLGLGSKSGVIRSVFYSSEEGLLGKLKPKGDPFTHQFDDGKFIITGTNQITIYGTDGYDEIAHFAFYRSQDEKRWAIEVKEAPSVRSNVNSFKSLANAPIEPIKK